MRPPGVRVLRRVGEQVDQHLRQPKRIGDERHRPVGHRHRQSVRFRVDRRTHGLHRRVDDRLPVDARAAQLQLAARDARKLEEIVEQEPHDVRLAVDQLAAFDHLRAGQLRARQQVRRREDRREGIAKLVRERREEAILQAIGAVQLLLDQNLLRRLGADHQHAAHTVLGGRVVDGAVRIGPVDVLEAAAPKDRDELVLVPGRPFALHHDCRSAGR
jgi:hypothetical protein